MDVIFDRYEKNICKVNEIIATYNYLSQNAKEFDCSIILRSQFVMLVSAFDTYVHCYIINKIIRQYFSEENFFVQSDIPLRLSFSMRGKTDIEQRKMIYEFFLKKLSKDSFQSPKSIEYAFNIIGIHKVWKRLGDYIREKSPEEIKGTLSLIVDRRNKIAHESDWDNISCSYRAITLSDVTDCRDFINRLVGGIRAIGQNCVSHTNSIDKSIEVL